MQSMVILVVAVGLSAQVSASESLSWKELEHQAIVSEKASAIAASKVEYYKKKHDLKSAIKWMNIEKKQYAKAQNTIDAAATAHPLPNKETATAQVTRV
jgi:hypothetical protein